MKFLIYLAIYFPVQTLLSELNIVLLIQLSKYEAKNESTYGGP